MIFRRQVLEKRQNRLYGAVIISTPLAFWVVAVFLVSLLAGAVTFAAVSTFARIEPVRGVVVPSGGIATVRAPSSGILSGLALSEGDMVVAGQQLGQITSEGAMAGEGSRLEAELDRIETQISNLQDRLQQTVTVTEIELDALAQQEVRTVDRITRLQRMLALREAAADETRFSYDRMTELTERDLASKRQLSAERLQVIAADRQVVQLESELAELSADLPEFPRRRQEIEARTRLNTLQLQAELDNLEAERAVLSANQSFAVTAPVASRVSAVMARTGHEVGQGETLFSILPGDRVLQAELYIPSRAIAFVEPGLPVRLLLDAFPYQRFGTASGDIQEVTTTVLLPGTEDTIVELREPVFRATVALHADHIEADGRSHPLQVGMTLTGNIILERRTILSRVIEPIVSVVRRY